MFSIGQMAKRASVSNRTLRYYEELGLISPCTRGENRYRYYDESQLRRLQTIKMLQEAGFALKEIVAVIVPALDKDPNITLTGQQMATEIFQALRTQRERLGERQKEISESIDSLGKMMGAMKECFGCRLSNSLDDCATCEHGPVEIRQFAQHKNPKQNREFSTTPITQPNSSKARSL